MTDDVLVPTTIIDGKRWLLLKHYGDVWEFRSFKMDKHPREVAEPSGHRGKEIKCKGAVKGRPTTWNVETFPG